MSNISSVASSLVFCHGSCCFWENLENAMGELELPPNWASEDRGKLQDFANFDAICPELAQLLHLEDPSGANFSAPDDA